MQSSIGRSGTCPTIADQRFSTHVAQVPDLRVAFSAPYGVSLDSAAFVLKATRKLNSSTGFFPNIGVVDSRQSRARPHSITWEKHEISAGVGAHGCSKYQVNRGPGTAGNAPGFLEPCSGFFRARAQDARGTYLIPNRVCRIRSVRSNSWIFLACEALAPRSRSTSA